MAYYYLISSLPMLKAEGDMPITYDQFLSLCKSDVGDAKYKFLKELSLSSDKGAFLSAWAKFYLSYREELTYQRNVRLGRKAVLPSVREEKVTKLIAAALNNKNPLLAEEELLALQFEKLDELIGIHYFDESALIGYALKLKLLERKTVFEQEKGKAEFGRIIENIEEKIVRMEQE